MALPDLGIDLRPRPAREAVDLGFDLLRADARPAWTAWAVAWGTLSLLTFPLAFLPGGGLWAPFLLWWLRPWPERVVVAVLARAAFGRAPGAREALREAWKARHGLFRFLTWKRPLGLSRCLAQPVWQLEGATSALSTRRTRQLAASGSGAGALVWGLACAHFEAVLALGLFGLAGLFAAAPGEAADPTRLLRDLFDAPAWMGPASHLSYALSAGLVAPFYAGGGFSLYLCRRAELEAWDVELALRRWVERVGRGALRALLLAVLLLPAAVRAEACPDSVLERAARGGPVPFLGVLPGKTAPLRADSASRAARLTADSLLRGDELRSVDCTTRWVARGPSETREPVKLPHLPWADAGILATVFKWLFIAGAAGLVGWLLWNYRGRLLPAEEARHLHSRVDLRNTPAPTPEAPLPADPATAALAAWNTGRHREAASLLYRATLARLERSGTLEATRGATEGRILRLAARLPPQAAETAREAVGIWSALAWSGRIPDDEAFRDLVARWRRAGSAP